MRDLRFYRLQAPILASAAALAGNAKIVRGDANYQLHGVSAFEVADNTDLSFIRDIAHLDGVSASQAGMCFCHPDAVATLTSLGVCVVATSPTPEYAFAKAASLLLTPRALTGQDSLVSPKAKLARTAKLAHNVNIGSGVEIGANTRIGPGAVIGPGCVIGANCTIGAGAVVGFAIIGEGVDIRPGAVIGEAGLGVITGTNGNFTMPHFGVVHLEDEVRIGANSTVDRAVFGETRIGARTKIDNLVHIAHNVTVGSDCVLAALSGIAGSAKLGDNVHVGGQAGILEHLVIGDGARIAASSSVKKNIAAHEVWGGVPARPLRQHLREQIILKNLAAKKTNRGVSDE